MSTIRCDIVSAEQEIFHGEATLVVAPGELGELGIAPRHAPLITRLKPGKVVVTLPDGSQVDIAISGGILEVQPQVVTVLADTAIRAEDIDEAAVQSTRDNAAANGVQLVAGLPDQAQGSYDTVLANILATPLKVLAPLLCGHVAAGGALVLAGVLERQTAELQAAYQPWLALEVADAEDGWVLLVGRRT